MKNLNKVMVRMLIVMFVMLIAMAMLMTNIDNLPVIILFIILFITFFIWHISIILKAVEKDDEEEYERIKKSFSLQEGQQIEVFIKEDIQGVVSRLKQSVLNEFKIEVRYFAIVQDEGFAIIPKIEDKELEPIKIEQFRTLENCFSTEKEQ